MMPKCFLICRTLRFLVSESFSMSHLVTIGEFQKKGVNKSKCLGFESPEHMKWGELIFQLKQSH